MEALGDVQRARGLYEALLPHADRSVNPGMIYCLGSVARYLGLLAKTLGRYDDAAAHFDRAIEIERMMPLWLARTRYEYARLLAARAAPRDRARAIALCGEAIEGARDYGMKRVAADAVALKLELEGITRASARSSIHAIAASAEGKVIDLQRAAAPSGTVTLLFADMDGLSELTEELGDVEAHRLVQTQRAFLSQHLPRHGGSEIEEQGDGFLLAFPSATEALRYAVGVQRALAAHRAGHPADRIHVRMGVHTGEPIKEGERFYGRTVILASRIATSARGDEILVSSLVRELAEPPGELRFDEGEPVLFEGLSGTVRIHSVLWGDDAPAQRVRPERAPSQNTFHREGEYWTITYDRRSIRMKDAKGVQYIAALLRRQGEEMHVAELVDGASAGGQTAAEVLDAKTRDDYRSRLEALRSELDEARAANDPGRAERLRQEIEFLTQELASAYGVGARSGRGSTPIDRTRKAVSSRVLDSIARIRKENPVLGAHFAMSIRMGLFCRYEPEKPVDWRLS